MAGIPAPPRPLRWANSLRFKASMAVVVFLAFVAGGLSSLFLATWEQRERATSHRSALQTAAALADVVASDLARGDPDRARATLESRIRHDPAVLLATISAGGDEIVRLDERLSDSARDRIGPGPAPTRDATRIAAHRGPGGPLLDVVVPLLKTGTDAPSRDGRLRLVFAVQPRPAQVAELRWRVIAIALAMLVLGSAGAMFLIGRILAPLPELARAAERIAEGDVDVSIRTDTDDDLGVLARSVAALARRLGWWQERHRTWGRELETRVEEKTREIAETREHLANIVENVGASILVADLDGTVVSANTHTMHIFGTKPEFAVGRPLVEFSGEAGANPETLLPHLATRRSRVVETQVGGDAGRARDLLVVQTLLRDSSGHAAGFLQIAKDVTELKEMERRLVDTQRLSAMGEMAGEIGHELNNYLMAIGGRAELIAAALADGADPRRLSKVERSAKIIAEQVAEMRRLTDGLLDASRKESSPQDVDLGELVGKTIEFVRPQNRFDGIRIELVRAFGELRVLADPQQIRQVALNLLTNAAEATRARRAEGGTIRVETFRENAAAGFRVSDDGVGIDVSMHGRIFEPHFTTKEKGHGFGLAVCHRVVANHGGSIHVESRPGQGASFTVRLPLPPDPCLGAAAAPGTEQSPSSPPPSPGSASPSTRFGRP